MFPGSWDLCFLSGRIGSFPGDDVIVSGANVGRYIIQNNRVDTSIFRDGIYLVIAICTGKEAGLERGIKQN